MKGTGRLVITLTLICVVAAVLLSYVHDLTLKPIATQKRLEKIRALKKVLPVYDNHPDKDTVKIQLKNSRFVEVNLAKKGGKIIAVAFRMVSHKGYGGDIALLMGVDMRGVVTGVEILSMHETPGLGARILEEPFKRQFKGKSLSTTKWAVKKDGGDIDQITGATISPRAVTEAIHRGLEIFSKNISKKIKTMEPAS